MTTDLMSPHSLQQNASLMLQNSSNQTNLLQFYGLDQKTLQIILNVTCIFGSMTAISNMVVLLASKFTTAGKSATLVFIRSLCIADTLVGIFGVFKSLLLSNIDSLITNCFLPESIFISASTTLALSLLWLNVDSYLRLTKPLGYARSMDKGNVITLMTILWNLAFIVGFLPQMGWNSDGDLCSFFGFYTTTYILFVGLMWFVCIISSCFFQHALHQITKKVRQNGNFISPQSVEFKKYSHLIITIRIDIVIWLFSYVPLLMYICFHCPGCLLGESEMANTNLAIFIPVFLIRSFVSAFVHSYRTVQIQQVIKTVPRRMSKALRKTVSVSSTEENASAIEMISTGIRAHNKGNRLQLDASATQVGRGLQCKHRPAQNTLSNITLFTTIEEASASVEVTRF